MAENKWCVSPRLVYTVPALLNTKSACVCAMHFHALMGL